MANTTINNATANEMEKRAKHIELILQTNGYDAKVNHVQVWKNNTKLDGFTAKFDSKDIAPTAYADDGADDFLLARRLIHAHNEGMQNLDIASVINRKYFMDHIRPAFVSDTPINREELDKADIIYMPYMGLGVLLTFRLEIDSQDGGIGTIKITNKIREMAPVTTAELMEYAVDFCSNNYIVKGMNEMMREMMPEMAELMGPVEEEMMYVLSTKDRLYGASVIISCKVMHNVSDQIDCEDFYILPSSVHEVLLVPNYKNTEDPGQVSALISMVKEVNGSEVKPEDQMADAVYRYHDGEIDRVA